MDGPSRPGGSESRDEVAFPADESPLQSRQPRPGPRPAGGRLLFRLRSPRAPGPLREALRGDRRGAPPRRVPRRRSLPPLRTCPRRGGRAPGRLRRGVSRPGLRVAPFGSRGGLPAGLPDPRKRRRAVRGGRCPGGRAAGALGVRARTLDRLGRLVGLRVLLHPAVPVPDQGLGAVRRVAVRGPRLHLPGGGLAVGAGPGTGGEARDDPAGPRGARRRRRHGSRDLPLPLAAVSHQPRPGRPRRPDRGPRSGGREHREHRHPAIHRGAPAPADPARARARIRGTDRLMARQDRENPSAVGGAPTGPSWPSSASIPRIPARPAAS